MAGYTTGHLTSRGNGSTPLRKPGSPGFHKMAQSVRKPHRHGSIPWVSRVAPLKLSLAGRWGLKLSAPPVDPWQIRVADLMITVRGQAMKSITFDFSQRLKPGDSSFTDWCWLSPARGCASLI